MLLQPLLEVLVFLHLYLHEDRTCMFEQNVLFIVQFASVLVEI